MRMRGLNRQVKVGCRCCSLVMLAMPYDQRTGVARRRGIGGSAAAPGHLEAIQGEVRHRAFICVSGLAFWGDSIVVALPLIEREEDAECG